MLSLQKYINESLLDDFDKIENHINPIDEIIKFMKDHYYCREEQLDIKLMNTGKYVVNVENSLQPKKKNLITLTNDLFELGEIWGDVDFFNCYKLISLKGGPKRVHGFFDCSNCNKLTSLDGSPEWVWGNFYCTRCPKLKSLKGGPKSIQGSLYCYECGKQFTEHDIHNAKIDVEGEINNAY